MEGCGTWTDLLNGCLGRRQNTEDQPVELAPQTNPYGRKLLDRLEEDAAKRANAPGRPQDGLPGQNPTTVPLNNNPLRPPKDLGDLANNANREALPPADDDSRDIDGAWHEMLDSLHGALRHTRYALSGRMAMSVWGCSRGARDTLSVVCPADSKEAVRIWAVSTGGRFTVTDAEPDILNFHSQEDAGSGGGAARSWRIRIRWLPEHTFEAMPKVEKKLPYRANPHTGEPRAAHVSVLTLPALLDNSAGAWADNLAGGTPRERLEGVALDVLSILDRIVKLGFREEGSGPLGGGGAAGAGRRECRRVMDGAFWVPFVTRYPTAPGRFAECGLGLPCFTRVQPACHGGMVYREGSSCLSPAGSARDAGRSLMGREHAVEFRGEVKVAGTETHVAEPGSSVRMPSFEDLFGTAAREDANGARVEEGRQERDGARQLEEQVHPGTGDLEERERERKGERRVRWEVKEEKEERKGGKSRRKHPRRSASRPEPSSSWSGHHNTGSMDRVRKQTGM